MVRSRTTAVAAALADKTNTPGTCQMATREWLGAPSAGDRDKDGDADAVDGWLSEPPAKRHTDRQPPAGTPVAWAGGRNGFGHRALSLGPVNGRYFIRSTDAGGSGKIATVSLDWVEKNWGLRYLGWSETITGQQIPLGTDTPAPVPGPAPVTQTVYGVDLSHYQFDNNFDLSIVEKNGYRFVILKCTQGTRYVDPKYKAARIKCEKLGLRTAVYHFLEDSDPVKQAANLASNIVDKTLPVFIDVEPTEQGSKPKAKHWIAFRKEAERLGLTVVAKYLTESYWKEIGSPSLVGPLVLWRAAYPSSKFDFGSVLYPGNDYNRWAPFGGQTPTIWQFASSGKLTGYSGKIDVNAFRGTLEDLDKLKLFRKYGAATPKPTPPVAVPVPVPAPNPTPKPAAKSKDFTVHFVPGNKTQTVASVVHDMKLALKKTHGNSAVVINTERESRATRNATQTGLGKSWTRRFNNENTILHGSAWRANGKPTARLLAPKDPHKKNVSGNRYLNGLPLTNKYLPGVVVKFKGTHLLSEANCIHKNVFARAWREKMWPVQLNDIISDLVVDYKAGIPQVVAGDFNTGVFFTGKRVFEMLQKHFGKDVTWVHNGELDQIYLISTKKVKLSEVKQEIETNNGSDHNMVTCTVRATVL